MTGPLAYVVIGRGGWHAAPLRTEKDTTVRISHYGDTWMAHDIIPGAPCVDLTACPEDDLLTFALAGPMVNPNLPPGTVDKIGGAVTFDPRPSLDRPPTCARLGNAHGFDTVSLDVYVQLAEAHGARVFDAAAAAAGHACNLEAHHRACPTCGRRRGEEEPTA